ncbi:monocarboxylate transporter 12-like [Dreissena polymorpha]|uniref:Major facilitator superfamily (MFS) profile domain-containing protein n=1 Tax=Dreissena polymorpha TaxID=45954 RepID=A0A9D4JCE4_DREPO|nr:monocarboxylate transporter 12-like [Dreissena polymorpha]KAH3804544.1 hypothetical protein DPMN_132831 [Dreissena polymorpha]
MSVRQSVPMDTGWAWMICLGYFVSVFCMVGIAKSFGILMEEFVGYFNVSVAMAALVMGVSGGMYTMAAPVCVLAGQHFTQRKVVMVGAFVGGLGLSLAGLLLSIEWVILTSGAMFGFGNACIFGNGLVMLGHYFKKRRSLANGLALSGASIGMFAVPPLLQYLLDTYSLKGTMVIIGGIYMNAAVAGALYRPVSHYMDPKVDSKSETNKLLGTEPAENHVELGTVRKHVDSDENHGDQQKSFDFDDIDRDAEDNKFKINNQDVLIGSVDSLHSLALKTEDQSKSNMADKGNEKKNRITNKCLQFIVGLLDFSVLNNFVVDMFVVVSFLIFFGHFNFVLFMPATATVRGYSKYDRAFLVSISGICDLVGRILVGVAGDLHFCARYKILATASLLFSLVIFGFAFATQYWLMGILVGLYGFLGGCYVAINAPVLIDLVGLAAMPKVLGVVLFIQGLGAAFGQPLLGAIRDIEGSFVSVHIVCSASALLGSMLLFFYPMVERLQKRRKNNINIIVKA